MSPLTRSAPLAAFKLAEMLLAVAAYVLARTLAVPVPYGEFGKGIAALQPADAFFVVGIMLAWHGLLLGRGLYASRRLDRGALREAVDTAAAAAWLTLLLGVAAALWHPSIAEPRFLVLFWALLCAATLLERVLLREILAVIRLHGRDLRFVLIVGSGQRAKGLAGRIDSRPELGLRLLGWVDDDPGAWRAQSPNRGEADGAPPYFGRPEELPRILSGTVVDQVFVMLPVRSRYERIQQVVLDCEEQGVPVVLPADIFPVRLCRTRLDHLDDVPVVCLSPLPLGDWQRAMKRALDVSGAALLLLLLAPVMLCVAVAVRASSPGSALFRQTRIGLNKRPFVLYKFRTMEVGAEARQGALESLNEAQGPVFKIRRDPRVTPLGHFLRRTSLDELPQLFNVLKGDMSLVGPRPLPVRDVAGFRKDWQRRRFSVLPGLTCLWQLSGRSNVSFEQWMALDLQYIDQWTLWLDLRILIRTPRVVLRGVGAY